MIRDKWMKLGAAGFLSIGMLAACGDAGNDTNVEDEDNVDIEPTETENEPPPEEESNEEAEDDALTDSLDNEDDTEDDPEESE